MEIWKMRKSGESWRKEHLPFRLGARSITTILEGLIHSKRTGKIYLVFSETEVCGLSQIGSVLIGGRSVESAEEVLELVLHRLMPQFGPLSLCVTTVPRSLQRRARNQRVQKSCASPSRSTKGLKNP
jgi:hypothetical protein